METGLLVLGITEAGNDAVRDVLAQQPGLDGRGVRLLPHEGVAVIVERIAVERPPGRRRDLLAYAQVLDEVARVAPVLPVRFDTVLATEAEVLDALFPLGTTDHAELLDRLSGRVQVVVRARYVEQTLLAEIVAGSPEIAELRRRTRDLPEDAGYAERVRLGELVAREAEDRRGPDAEAVLDLLGPGVEAQVRPGGGLEHIVDLAVLVQQDDLPALEERLEAAAEAWHDRVRLQLVGPSAPYDFVGTDLDEESAWD